MNPAPTLHGNKTLTGAVGKFLVADQGLIAVLMKEVPQIQILMVGVNQGNKV